MALVNELKLLIFSYLPLTKLQILEEQGLSILVNANYLRQLLKTKYKLTNVDLTSTNVLSTFDQFTKYATLSGDIGYNGQFYVPVLICIAYSIRNKDNNLLNYYLLRFFVIKYKLRQLAFKDYQSHIFILLTLANEYNKDIYDYLVSILEPLRLRVFTNSTTVITLDDIKETQFNSSVFNLPTALAAMDIDAVKKYANMEFNTRSPIGSVVDDIAYRGNLITISYINKVRVMRDLVLKLFTASDARNQYLDALAILLGDDIDLQPYINTNNFNDIVRLAFAVLNSKVITEITKHGTPDFATSEIPASEVVYNVSILSKIYDSGYRTAALTSIYLANRANEITKRLPLLDTLNDIKAAIYKGGTLEALVGGAYILDPETAVKLQDFNTSDYLYPVTQFNYDLMVQFGFRPPHKQLE